MIDAKISAKLIVAIVLIVAAIFVGVGVFDMIVDVPLDGALLTAPVGG
jgi:hypothetical protein